MGRTSIKPVDYEKLIAAIKARGYANVKKAGPEMGYTEGWMTGPRCNGRISDPLLKALEFRFNIKYDEIKPDEPKQEPAPEQLTIAHDPQPVTVNVEITPDTISEALVNVMMNQEVRNQLVQIVYYAVNKAIRNNNK